MRVRKLFSDIGRLTYNDYVLKFNKYDAKRNPHYDAEAASGERRKRIGVSAKNRKPKVTLPTREP